MTRSFKKKFFSLNAIFSCVSFSLLLCLINAAPNHSERVLVGEFGS